MKNINKRDVSFILVAIILGVMALTNRDIEHFREYAKKKLIKRGFTEAYIKDSLVVARTNYFLFSQYSIRIIDYGVPIQETYIGAFNTFFELGFTKKAE